MGVGINRKVQIKPLSWAIGAEGAQANALVTSVQLVLKWGGELTELGLTMAEKAGHIFREEIYPRGVDNNLLRLHSTFQHDLKIYSSDEGRVQMTAAAFARGMLELDGNLPPILVSLVRKDKAANQLLDDSSAAADLLTRVKTEIHRAIKTDQASALLAANTLEIQSVTQGLAQLKNTALALRQLHTLVQQLVREIQQCAEQRTESFSSSEHLTPPALPSLYHNESILLLLSRWEKLAADLYNTKKDDFDVSKVHGGLHHISLCIFIHRSFILFVY